MKKIIVVLLLINLLFTFYMYISNNSSEKKIKDFANDILKVRGIIVVDSLGVERAILAAHLPEAQRDGGRMYSSRSQTAVSGLMLYDSEGIERGGYVTDDDYGNIFLTLDSKDNQTALFLAEPQGATTMSIWSRTGNKANFTTSDSGLIIDFIDNGKKIKVRKDD